MIHILLACAGGMSTSMLVEKMDQYAKANHIDAYINAVAEGTVMKVIDNYDVLLLGPQVSHMVGKFQENLKAKAIPVSSIDMMDYGMMNGENVVKKALRLVGENYEK